MIFNRPFRSRAKRNANPNAQMPFVSHLAELRHRIIVSLVAVAVAAVVAFALFQPILNVLTGPYCDIRPPGECTFLQTDPLEGFAIRITVSTYAGIALAMPVLLFQFWRFITPALSSNEKRYAVPFVLAGVILFLLGAALAFWTVPKALEFLVAIGGGSFEQRFTGSAYISFLTKMMVGAGIGFEFPIVLIFLQIAHILHPHQLARVRRYAIVGIVTLVAVLTPSGDPFSLMILSVPMYLFFESSIVTGRFLRK